MLTVHYSNDIYSLVRSLTQELGAAGDPASPFTASPVIVPNANVETFLKFEIARTRGIFAGLRFLFLEKFLSGLVAPAGGKRVALDRRSLQNVLVNLFLRPGGENLPAEVAEYLSPAGLPEEDLARRAWQLADRLSRNFEEYAQSRPEMLEQWRKGKWTIEGGTFSGTEAWQGAVWRMLFCRDGRLERISASTGKQFLLLQDYPALLASEEVPLPARLHIFGFSYVSRSHNRIIEALAARTGVSVYALNPCREFWEDVLTLPEAFRLKQVYSERSKRRGSEALLAEEDPFHLGDAESRSLLGLWGRPGRENIRILNELTESEFHSAFTDPLERGSGLLHRVQHDVLFRAADPAVPSGYDAAGDESLRILACPDVRREVEIIANEIWSLVREDEQRPSGAAPLRFNDIAVIVADTRQYDSYCAHLSSVFVEVHDIPHTVSDLTPGGSRTAEAVGLLLALPAGNLTRSDLLGVLTHPALLSRFPEADAEEWVRWCDELSIHRGADAGDLRDTYIEKDLYTWDQGVRRLALGAFLEGDRSGEQRPFRAPGQDYLPRELSPASLANAARFSLLVRSLIADVKFMREARLSLAEWSDLLVRFVTAYLQADTAGEERLFSRCLGEIAMLARLDQEGEQVPFAVAREFAAAAVAGLTRSRGRYLANGVVVTSFLPMRPLPFRAVFIAGLGEGLFPAREMKDPLDLRNHRRIAGDVSMRERDQYNFLETLVSTRDRLCLSYVSRDSQTGEPLEPSSIIKELQFYIEQNYGPSGRQALKTVRHPLRRYDERYFPGYFPGALSPLPSFSAAAEREARANALKQDLARFLKEKGLALDRTAFEGLCGGSLAGLLRPLGPLLAAAAEEGAALQVPIAALRRFLECPLQGWAGYVLGLREDELDNEAGKDDEVFSTEWMHVLMLRRRAFLLSLREPDPPAAFERFCGDALFRNELLGISPTGLFSRMERKRSTDKLRAWWSNGESADIGQAGPWETIRFGRADEHEAVDASYPPLTLELPPAPGGGTRPLRIELFGRLDSLSPSRDRTLTLIDRSSEIGPREFLRGFLNLAILAAAGLREEQPMDVTVLSSGAVSGEQDPKKQARTVAMQGMATAQAQAYLAGLAAELLRGTHAYLLPIEAVVEHQWSNKRGRSYGEIIDRLREQRQSFTSLYGPVPRPAEYEPPSEAEAGAMVSRRFGPFIERLPREW